MIRPKVGQTVSKARNGAFNWQELCLARVLFYWLPCEGLPEYGSLVGGLNVDSCDALPRNSVEFCFVALVLSFVQRRLALAPSARMAGTDR